MKNGKEARSEWRVLHKGQGYSLLGVRIFTGRTHQIRVHMAHVGHPLWGDKLYGRGGQVLTPPVPGVLLKHDPAPRQMLHAWHLSFIHPFTGEKMAFTCPPPEDFVQTALTLERHMRRVVVTGVAGSGKSLFMRMLAEEGVPTWSADAAVIRLYEPGREAWQALRLRYGDRFIPDDRSPVDRKALAAALLPSAESGVDVHELENLLHPLVLDDLERFWSGQEEAGGYAVAEVPLWFESGWSRKLCGERRPYVVGFPASRANAPPPAGSAGLVGYAHGPDGRPPVDAGAQAGGMRSGHRQFRDGRGVARQGKGFCPGDGALGCGKPRRIPWAVGASGE
ncbi:MAG: dephospho-CoA kinase [Bilophila wadsworthia]